MLEIIARQFDPDMSRALDTQAARVNELVSSTQADPRQITLATDMAANTADRLARDLMTMHSGPSAAEKLINAICADSGRIAGQGERSAEQSAMVVNSLYVAYLQGRNKENDARIRTAIDALYKQFENASAYNPETFARGLRDLGNLIGGA